MDYRNQRNIGEMVAIAVTAAVMLLALIVLLVRY
jgi:hypothetical protein